MGGLGHTAHPLNAAPNPSQREITIDHLGLDDAVRDLIAQACGKADRVFLDPLDKGLSGSRVWLARWKLGPFGPVVKDHVLKIGPRHKLEREEQAVTDVAAAIDRDFPHMRLFVTEKDEQRALLRQQFVGGVESLRQRLSGPECGPQRAAKLVEDLYGRRMKRWHFADGPSYGTESSTLGGALAGYVKHAKWDEATAEVGAAAMNSAAHPFAPTSNELQSAVADLMATTDTFTMGPAHGDLHSQNVLVAEDGHIELIDFGKTTQHAWRAVDFLMLECSVKFLVAPQHVDVEYLIEIDRLLDRKPDIEPDDVGRHFASAPYGRRLATAAVAVATIRRLAAEAGAVTESDQYERGLVTMTTGLLTLPGHVNRPYLVRTIAYHLKNLS